MNTDHLMHMLNQIAVNLAAQGEATAVAETAQHVVDFWDPRMKAGLFAADLTPLSPIARAAVDQLIAAHA